MKWKKIDLHIHTKKTHKDSLNRELTDDQILKKISNLDICSFTNHDTFSLDEYNKYKESVELLLPGIELSLKGQHIIIISSQSDVNQFNSDAKEWERRIFGKMELEISDFEEIFSGKNYIYIPHAEKDPFNKNFLKQLKGLVVYEPSKFKDFTKLKATLEKIGIIDPVMIFGSDNRDDAEEVFIYTGTGFIDLVKSLKNQDNISNERKPMIKTEHNYPAGVEKNLFDINFKTYGKLNVIIGKKGSGKSFLANLIGINSKGTFNKIKQGKIDELKDKSKFIKEVENWISQEEDFINKSNLESEVFIERYIKYDNLLKSEEEKLITNLKVLKKWAKQDKENSFDNLTSLSDVEDYNSNEYAKLKEIKTKLAELSKYEDYLSRNFLHHLKHESSIVENNVKEHKYKEQAQITKKLIFKNLKKFVTDNSRTLIPKPPMDSISKIPPIKQFISEEIENINKKILSFDKKEEKIELLMGDNVSAFAGWSVFFKKTRYIGSKPTNPMTKTELEFEKPFTKYLESRSTDDVIADKEKFKEKNFITTNIEVRDSKGNEPSGGQKSALYIVKTFANFNSDRIILDEVDAGFDSDILNDEMFIGIKELASRGKEIYIVTHRPPLAINIKPDTIIEVSKKDDGTREVKSYTLGKAIENKLFEIVEGGKENYKYRKRIYEN